MNPLSGGRAAHGHPTPRWTRALLIGACAGILATVYSCDTVGPEEGEYAIEFPSAELQLEVDQTQAAAAQLTRGGEPVEGTQLAYRSSAPDVVSVDDQGLLRARRVGTATITANAQGESGTLTVRVVAGGAVALVLTQNTVGFNALTDTVRVRAFALNKSGNQITTPIGWTSENRLVASVTPDGLVRAVGLGTTRVLASAGSVVEPIEVTVAQFLAGLRIQTPTQSSPTVRRGATLRLTALGVDRLGSAITSAPVGVLWSSDDPTIAAVDQAGNVRGMQTGRTKIRVRAAESAAPALADAPPPAGEFDLEVLPTSVASVTISPASATLDVSEQIQLTAVVRDGEGNDLAETVVWITTNPAVATVTAAGLVTGIGVGQGSIRATAGGRTGTTWVAVEGSAPTTSGAPGRPTIGVSAVTATGATLSGSAFSDPDAGDTHAESNWQVDEDGEDWSSPVVDVTAATSLTSRSVNGLDNGASYKARVRYRDNKGNWSAFSTAATFVTGNSSPAAPTLTVTGVTMTGVTLNGSGYSDPDGDAHLRSQWQVDEMGGDWTTSPVFNVTASTNLTSRPVTGLAAGTTYQARVRYGDDAGSYSAYSPTVTFTTVASPTNTAPAAPALTIDAITSTGAQLNGSAFSDPDAGDTHAQTTWQIDEQGGNWTTLVFNSTAATNLTSRSVIGLQSNRSYQARARYQDDRGAFSAYGAAVTFTTANTAPNAPTLTVGAITATGATLSGSAFSDADVGDTHTQSHWQVDEQGGDWSTLLLDVTSATDRTSRVVGGLQAGRAYQARVRYQDAHGAFGAFSDVEPFATGNTPPATPTLTVTNLTSTGATLNGSPFSDPDGSAHARTHWQVDEQGGDWSTPLLSANGTTELLSRVVTGLAPHRGYQARVRYADSQGSFGAYSASVSFSTTSTAPGAPTVTASPITSTGVTLIGSAFADLDAGDTHAQTNWQIDEQGGDWSTLVFSSTAATNLTTRAITGLRAHTAYQARARYQDNAGTFGAFGPALSFTTTNSAPGGPTVTVTALTTSGATLNGGGFADPDVGDTHAQTNWQVDEQGGDWSTPVLNTTAATNLTSRPVTGLNPHTAYQARARYQDNQGTFGAFGATVTFTTAGTAPAAPTVSVTAITTSGATLNGSAFTDADAGDTHAQTHWQIDEQGGNWTTPVLSVTAATNLTSRPVTGLGSGLAYQARARYQDNAGTFGPYGPTVSFTTTGVTNNPPATPTLTVSGITSSGATLTGSAFSDPNGSTHAGTNWQVDEQGGDWSTPIVDEVGPTNLTSRTVSGLLAGTAYQARVRYIDNGGAVSGYSTPRTFTTSGSGGGGAPTIVFSSDWATARGTAGSAITDGGRWNTRLCNFTNVANIVAGNTVGFTETANVMEMTRTSGYYCTQVETQPIPGVAEAQDYYIRMYIRNDATDANFNASNHPVCINCSGDIQFIPWANWYSQQSPDTRYRPKMASSFVNTGNEYDRRWEPPELSNGVWYRFEWHIDFVSPNGSGYNVRVWPRIYDMAGRLLYDSDDYHRIPGFGGGDLTQTLTAWYASGGRFYLPTAALTRRFGVGYEGVGGAVHTGEHWYYAGVAISVGDWAGPIP